MASQARDDTKQFIPFDETRYLQVSSIVPRLKKEDIPLTQRPLVVAWGTLRLFLMTLNFFNRYVKLPGQEFDTMEGKRTVEKTICVYAGAAPGISLVALNKLYPTVQYELYDPLGESQEKGLRFADQLFELSNVNLHHREFDDVEASKWREYMDDNPTHTVYFISDIRNINYPKKPERNNDETEEQFKERYERVMTKREEIIEKEMDMQKRWTNTMRPFATMLKFRPPMKKDEKIFVYLDGFIYRGVYGDLDSLENFLVPSDNISTREWNLNEYEESVNYHNYIFRAFPFINVISGTKEDIAPGLGLGKNYDSVAFVSFIRDYLESFGRSGEKPSGVFRLIDKLTKILGRVDENDANPLRTRVAKSSRTTTKSKK